MILGGITIAWVEHTVDQIPQIVMLQPFCHKDFAIRSLGDRIKDLNQCVHLYPDIPKDKAFGNYYTPQPGKHFSFVCFLREKKMMTKKHTN